MAGIPTGRERWLYFKFRGTVLELQSRELGLETPPLPKCLASLRNLETGPWRATLKCHAPHWFSHIQGFAYVPTSRSNHPNHRKITDVGSILCHSGVSN